MESIGEQQHLATETGRLKTSYEKHRHDEYAGIVQALEKITTFARTANGRHPMDRGVEFEGLVKSRNQLVEQLAELPAWNEQAVKNLEELKQDFITLTGYQNLEENLGDKLSPHIWWRAMIGEAFFKRIWPSAYMVSGDEEAFYAAFQDEQIDRAGIDFLDLVEYEGDEASRKKFLVCTQFKTSSQYPVGQIIMVDLLNLSQQGEAVLENIRANNPDYLRRVRNAAAAAERKLGSGNETVAVVMVVLGMKDPKDKTGSWKTIIREGDDEATRLYFAGQLDDFLSGETDYFEPRQEAKWYDQVLDKRDRKWRKRPQLKGEAKYQQYSQIWKTKNLPDEEEPGERRPI